MPILGEGETFGINGSFGVSGKKFSTNLSKGKTKISLNLHYHCDNSYLFVNGKKSVTEKQIIKMPTFQINFVWEAYLLNSTISIQEKYL